MELSYPIALAALRLPLQFGWQWHIDGLQFLPVHGRVILASNHISYFDPFALGYVADRRRRRARFLAKSELFSNPVLGPVLRNGRQIPVYRHTTEAAEALVGGLDALEHGECVAVFPEGTIAPDLNPIAGHTGTARLAALSAAPVVPVGVWGTQRIVTKAHRAAPSLRVPVSVMLGSPLYIAADEDMHDATDRIMTAICDRVAAARSRYPDQANDAWWYRSPADAVMHSCRESA